MNDIHVLATQRFSDDLLRLIQAVSPRIRLSQQTCRDAADVEAALAEHPGTEVLYALHVPPDSLSLAPQLRWLQLHSAGADHLLGHPILQSGVLVTTTSGIHATPIAEYVMASFLAHRWQVARWTRCQRGHEWPTGRWSVFARPELRGTTVGILGYGSIGREVARLASAFGMHVLAMARTGRTPDRGYQLPGTGDPGGTIPVRFYPPSELREMLAQSDYVVLALPLTPATTHLIGEAELRAMRPGAYLVNIARGPIVDETALAAALREGWIAGAGLDVFEVEPLPPGSPLWDMDNVLISPHIAGHSPLYNERAAALFAENLRRYVAGELLLNLVDKAAGY